MYYLGPEARRRYKKYRIAFVPPLWILHYYSTFPFSFKTELCITLTMFSQKYDIFRLSLENGIFLNLIY